MMEECNPEDRKESVSEQRIWPRSFLRIINPLLAESAAEQKTRERMVDEQQKNRTRLN